MNESQHRSSASLRREAFHAHQRVALERAQWPGSRVGRMLYIVGASSAVGLALYPTLGTRQMAAALLAGVMLGVALVCRMASQKPRYSAPKSESGSLHRGGSGRSVSAPDTLSV